MWIAQSTHRGERMTKPTEETYREFQVAYDFLNHKLFNDQLPGCLITMQRRSRTYGFYCNRRFVNPSQGRETDEIALNPSYFMARTVAGVLSTLAHEMNHLRQYQFGKPGRRGYHNREWADSMIAIGLHPSDTGEPDGRETGYHMTHYIVEAGPFDLACNELLSTDFRLSWLEKPRELFTAGPPTGKVVSRTDGSNRWKYTCPKCLRNAWAKPDTALICGVCLLQMLHG